MVEEAEEVFEARFRSHWDGVFRIIWRLVGDSDEAEDLALEVFWKLYQTPPRLKEEAELRAWLFRVATNLGYNALRARRRRSQYELAGGQLNIEERGSLDPSSETQRREEQDQVREVLAGMKKRQAQLIALRYSGFSYIEIADTLEISTASVGTLLSRAEAEFERRYRAREGREHVSS